MSSLATRLLLAAVIVCVLVAPCFGGPGIMNITITDDPCPIGAAILEAAPKTQFFVFRSAIPRVELLGDIQTCFEGDTGVVTPDLKTLDMMLVEVEQAPVITLANLETLLGMVAQLRELLAKALPGDPGAACADALLVSFLEGIELTDGSSIARTLGKDGWSGTVHYSRFEIDEVGGDPLPSGERLDVDLAVLAAAHGLSDRWDASLLVPFLALDLPDSLAPLGSENEVGDVVLGTKVQVVGKDRGPTVESRTALSVWADVTLPTGEDDRFAGTGHWGERLGIVADTVLGGGSRSLVVVPSLAAWLSARAGQLGWGADGRVDLTGGRWGGFAGLRGHFNQTDDPDTDDYLDALVGLRFRAFPARFDPKEIGERSGRLDVTLSYDRPLLDEGALAGDGSLSLALQGMW